MEEKAIQKVAESTNNVLKNKNDQSIDDFFKAYELSFNKGLEEGGASVKDSITSSFSSCFIESSPTGVICGTNDRSFRDKIEQAYAMYRKIGSKSMEILSKESTLLNASHAMVKVKWRYTAVKEGKDIVIEFENFYFLTGLDKGIKIFGYIAGDEQKALKENGLL